MGRTQAATRRPGEAETDSVAREARTAERAAILEIAAMAERERCVTLVRARVSNHGIKDELGWELASVDNMLDALAEQIRSGDDG